MPDPAGGGEFICVARHAGRRQFVDEREHHFGEPRGGRRRESGRDRSGRELSPRHSSADPVGRQQGIDRPAGAGLTPTQVVGAVERRRQPRPRIGVMGPGGQTQERAQRQLYRVLDGLPHRSAERVGVARHLGRDRRDGPLGHLRQHPFQGPDYLLIEVQATESGSGIRHNCSFRTNCSGSITLPA